MKPGIPAKFWFIAGLLVANLVFFGLFSPTNSPSVVLGAAFLLLTLDIYLVIYTCLVGLGLLLNQPKVHSRRVAGLLTGTVMVLVALQSIGELSVRDGLAIVILAVIISFYSSYYGSRRRA
jgi:hypothetical protein